MAGAACKIIINNGVGALTKSLEEILISLPLVGLIGERERKELIQALADIDLAAYGVDGDADTGPGLLGIMERLYSIGILSDDVWRIYERYPDKLDAEKDVRRRG